MRRIAFAPWPLIATSFILACGGGGGGGGTPPPATLVPTSIIIGPGDLSLDALQGTQQLTATVRDQNGATMTSQVQWTSADPTVASVSSSGLVTALKNGSSRITATAGAASASILATVLQRATALTVTSGSNQTGTVGAALPQPLVVTARDSRGNTVSGTAVSFAVNGGGSVGNTSATTAANGEASTTWTLGRSTASAQSVVASLSALPATTVTFTATPVAGAPTQAMKFSGDNQQWSITKPLPDPIAIRVVDQFNNGVAGITVTFTPTAGGGTVSATTATTDNNGEARVSWTLGPTEGGQSVRAQPAVPAQLLSFFATALRVDLGSIGPTPFKVGCSIQVRGTGYNLADLSKNRVTIDGIVAPITDGIDNGLEKVLVVTVPTLPNTLAHPALVEVTAYGTTTSGTYQFDPNTSAC